ncbi:AAA family ATPase [Myxococcota bacterium]|nr:AAA family ATPase [Myxococcota bacterium]
MIRPDANRIALRATRAILDAAHDFRFDLAGRAISVRCTRQAAPAWPRVLSGLDQATDSPWPTPVTVEASWEGGASRLVVLCDYWRRTDDWEHAIGLRVSIAETRREILWITLMFSLAAAADGAAVPMRASVAMVKAHEDEDRASFLAHNAALRALVSGSGIPMLSPAQAHLCTVAVPGAEVTPDPATAFERAVLIGVAKHAWFERRERAGFQGAPFVDVAFAVAGAVASGVDRQAGGPAAEDGAPTEGRRAGIWPLPGGVRAYMTTLRALLQDIAEREPMPIAALEQLFEERYQATGRTAVKGYRFVLRALGYAAESDGEVSLTDMGQAWLVEPGARALFEVLNERFIGILEPLVLAEVAPALPRARVHAVLREVLGTEWKTGNQVDFRRNWLLSLGFTERTAAGDAITAVGAEVLAAHADAAEDARAAIREALAAPEVPQPGDDLTGDDVEGEAGEAEPGSGPATPPSAAPGWRSEQVDLSARTITAHLGRLRLDDRVVQQLAAAVSAGKHVLLVGPPGTGKTELAVALTRAAVAEGYCAGLFTATASADWTTFDTIGGYAMQKDQTLAFRPGAFLRAIVEQKWLLVDELNRADVDRAFGELMTVLAGQGTDTHYELEGGRRVSIGSEETRTFRVPKSFRVLATMNTWDKTSLFRLSYAVQRRFAIINVGLPPDLVYEAVLTSAAEEGALLPPLSPPHLPAVVRLFSTSGLLSIREIGPAVAIDVVRYLRRRGETVDGLAEAMEMYVLPQLQGLGERAAKEARERCEEALGAGASTVARASLRARFRELFPGLSAADD